MLALTYHRIKNIFYPFNNGIFVGICYFLYFITLIIIGVEKS